MNAADGTTGMVCRLARIAADTIIAKYRLSSGRGFLFAAIFDPYLYALTVYFVQATVCKLDSIERFHIPLIGFMAFRWGMSSLLASANLIGILRRMAEHSPTPLTADLSSKFHPFTSRALWSFEGLPNAPSEGVRVFRP